jgi:serine/threonine protein phosphatase PrpC
MAAAPSVQASEGMLLDKNESECPADHHMMTVSTFEAMNASRRSTMEDVHVVHPAGTWGAPDKDLTYLAVYDGHGGRDMVDFLENGLTHHVAEELRFEEESEDLDYRTRLERAFLMADIHARQAGVRTSGATVALCLVKVCMVLSVSSRRFPAMHLTLSPRYIVATEISTRS